MNIINVGYDSTNYYVLADTRPKLLVDVGWPGTLPRLQYQCKRMSIALTDIPYFLITHYHPDHAGLAQELKRMGCKLILMDNQLSAVPVLRAYMKPENHYVDIELTNNVNLTCIDSRTFLARLGILGEIISTPGHSDDSITLILDEGAALVGDLTHPSIMDTDVNTTLHASWQKIRAFDVKNIYPGHGPMWRLM